MTPCGAGRDVKWLKRMGIGGRNRLGNEPA